MLRLGQRLRAARAAKLRRSRSTTASTQHRSPPPARCQLLLGAGATSPRSATPPRASRRNSASCREDGWRNDAQNRRLEPNTFIPTLCSVPASRAG